MGEMGLEGDFSMSKILDWIKKHVWQTILIVLGLFFLPLSLVHIAYRITAVSPWFASICGAGELITYIAGFEAFIGTVFLGIVAVRQNDKANELNELMLKREEKRDFYERQPLIDHTNLSSTTISNLRSLSGEEFSSSMCYFQKDYAGHRGKKDDARYVCLSFDLNNTTAHPIKFRFEKANIKDIYIGAYDQNFEFVPIIKDYMPSELRPFCPQNFVFLVPENCLTEMRMGKLCLTLILTNRIDEIYEAKYEVLFVYYTDGKCEYDMIGHPILKAE